MLGQLLIPTVFVLSVRSHISTVTRMDSASVPKVGPLRSPRRKRF
jgi:hypothetical protein